MALFFGSFAVFVLVALALGISVVFKGRPMEISCRGAPARRGCKSIMRCRGTCRHIDDV